MLPEHTDEGLAVAVVIVGFAFEITAIVFVNVQPPPLDVKVYVYDPEEVGAIVTGFEVNAEVAPLPAVEHNQLYDNAGDPVVGVAVKTNEEP